MNTVPLSVLIEANECLKLARTTAPAGAYSRILEISVKLDVQLQALLENQAAEVTA